MLLFSKAWHTLEDMLLGGEARTALFLCTHAYMTHALGTVRNLVGTKRILVHVCVVAGAICKSSTLDEILKVKVHHAPSLSICQKF